MDYSIFGTVHRLSSMLAGLLDPVPRPDREVVVQDTVQAQATDILR
jgi:hypothetical protein